MIRVLLVDDHKLVRTGIRKILETASDIEVVAEASTGEESLRLVERFDPDIVLMDKFMPGIGGMEATRRIVGRSRARVICLTVSSAGPLPRRVLELGAHGFLTKACAPEEMIEAVRKVYAGQRYLGVELARRLADDNLSGESNAFDALSERELQVSLMITQGYGSQKISQLLSLSPKTISTYRTRIFQKLEIGSDVDLVRLAIENGILENVLSDAVG